jgi:hypothetical protein
MPCSDFDSTRSSICWLRKFHFYVSLFDADKSRAKRPRDMLQLYLKQELTRRASWELWRQDAESGVLRLENQGEYSVTWTEFFKISMVTGDVIRDDIHIDRFLRCTQACNTSSSSEATLTICTLAMKDAAMPLKSVNPLDGDLYFCKSHPVSGDLPPGASITEPITEVVETQYPPDAGSRGSQQYRAQKYRYRESVNHCPCVVSSAEFWGGGPGTPVIVQAGAAAWRDPSV